MPIYEPSNIIGLLGYAIVALVTLATAVIAAFGARRGIANGKKMETVRDQVQNGHTRNLRDDLDDVRNVVHYIRVTLKEMHEEVSCLRRDIGGMRGELGDERDSRTSFERRVTEAHRLDHPDGPAM